MFRSKKHTSSSWKIWNTYNLRVCVVYAELLEFEHCFPPQIQYILCRVFPPVHKSEVTQEWFEDSPDVLRTFWPAKLPDLNPIENVCWQFVLGWDVAIEQGAKKSDKARHACVGDTFLTRLGKVLQQIGFEHGRPRDLSKLLRIILTLKNTYRDSPDTHKAIRTNRYTIPYPNNSRINSTNTTHSSPDYHTTPKTRK